MSGGNDMPSQNIVKTKQPESYFYVRVRSIGKQDIFVDDSDYWFFLSLFERCSQHNEPLVKIMSKYPVNDSVEILAYCLVPNLFHLLLCQTATGGVAGLMHDIIVSYNKYYRGKYKADDMLSESNYEVSKIVYDDLLDASRHIHRNPDKWMDYPYSSIRAYLYDDVPDWLNKRRISELYGTAGKYLEYLKEY
jgi:hypothetical protein